MRALFAGLFVVTPLVFAAAKADRRSKALMDDNRTTERGRGRHAQVLENQRARVRHAIAEVVAEQGLRGASASHVAKRAGVSRAALAEHFGSLDDCFLALLDWMLERATALTAAAFERESSWEDGVLAGLEALLAFLDREPTCTRACLLESVAGLSPGLQLRAQTLGRLGLLVNVAARKELSLERQPPAVMSEATLGSVLGILRRRLISGDAPPFVGLFGQLAEVVVAPYFGPAAAAQAARKGHNRAQALLRTHSTRSASADIEVPSMLRHGSAYRMRACVRYLAENPGASNQDVASGIEVSHPGQVSVLLARLHNGGLLVKDRGGAGRPNAWRLSPHGAEVAQVLFRH